MPEITNTIDANSAWMEFQDKLAKITNRDINTNDSYAKREEYEYVMSLAEELIRAAYNNEVMPCISRLDHQFDGGTYSSCWKCGEPEH